MKKLTKPHERPACYISTATRMEILSLRNEISTEGMETLTATHAVSQGTTHEIATRKTTTRKTTTAQNQMNRDAPPSNTKSRFMFFVQQRHSTPVLKVNRRRCTALFFCWAKRWLRKCSEPCQHAIARQIKSQLDTKSDTFPDKIHF